MYSKFYTKVTKIDNNTFFSRQHKVIVFIFFCIDLSCKVQIKKRYKQYIGT
jgi:hypothetical protein